MELSDKKFAVLIDADNISHRKIKDILDEIANYGTPTIKRIYGDFTDPKFAAWKSILLENSITPIQQYAYTTGKNATDSALIIDAMDILHKESVNGFCIVSSDSDYTRLASRIRESGREVLGFGEKKTPKPFIKSCDKFIYVEILGQPAAPTPALAPAPGPAPAATQTPAAKAAQKRHPPKGVRRLTRRPPERKKPPQAKTAPAPGQTPGVVPASEQPQVTAQSQTLDPAQSQSIIRPIDDDFKDLLANTIEDAADDSGWAFLGIVGSVLTKKMPDFDPRNYGYKKLSLLVKALSEAIETEERLSANKEQKFIYVRNRTR
ncbi:MAG: NYN domain-containing protein [Alistipes finegoldii]